MVLGGGEGGCKRGVRFMRRRAIRQRGNEFFRRDGARRVHGAEEDFFRERGEDFSRFLWDMVGGAPIQNQWEAGQVPAQTPLAVEMSKALKAKGFKFCGPVIVYAFMQATGMVNDHVKGCFRCDEVRAMGAS